MKYFFSIAVNSRCDVAVTANSLDEAKEKALDEFRELDLGQTTDVVDYEIASCSDGDGNYFDI